MKIFIFITIMIIFSIPAFFQAVPYDFEFGRPIQKGEMIYNQYRENHAEVNYKRLGLSKDPI